MAKGSPRDPAAAQALVAENLQLDADSFEEPEDELEAGAEDGDEGAEVAEGDEEYESHSDGEDGDAIEGEETDEGTPGPDELDGLTLQEEPAARSVEREARFDRKGNVVDTKTGKIIAPAGPAARFYQDAYKARQEVVQYRARVEDAQSRLDRAIEIGTRAMEERDHYRAQAENPVAKQLGLGDTEVVDALQLAKRAKTDPKGALQQLLTRAAANGIDIASLGISGTEGLGPMLGMVREEIAKLAQPITEQQRRDRERADSEARNAETFARTEASVRRYFEERPDQVQFLPIYNQVLQNPQFRHMSLGEIGARIETNLLRQRFEAGRRPANPPARSRPNSRASVNGQGARSPMDEMAPVSMSYDAILKPIVSKFYRA